MATKAQELIAQINQQFGAGTMKLASDPEYQVNYLPTGLAPIDDLFLGGLPFGRHVMIHGDYSTLKSYVGLCAIASAQKRDLVAALIDTENSFDPDWAKRLGVDLEQLVMPPKSKIETGEKAIDMAESLLRGGVDLLVFDSIAAALPQAEWGKSMEDANQLARQAAMFSKGMRKLTAANRKTAILWINQTRVNPGIAFGNPEVVPAGKAIPFYCTYIAGFYKGAKATEEVDVFVPDKEGKPAKKKLKQTVGYEVRVNLYKSKLNKPFREETFVYSLKEGAIDEWLYLANKALNMGLLGYERGRWWTPEDNKKLTTAEFRGHVPLAELKKLLHGTVTGVESAGDAPQGSKKAEPRKRRSSSATAQKPIQTAVLDVSSSTAATTTKSSRSRTRKSPTALATSISSPSARQQRSVAAKAS